MGYVLPGWLDEILDFIGINWPNVDEDDYREMADAMRELADAFDDHAGEAHGAVSRLLSSSEGWAVDALQEHWGKVKGSHLEQLPEVARLFADAMDVVADVIYGMKVKAEVELGIMAASVGISIGLAAVTGGLSALIGAAEIAAMRELVRRIVKEAADQIVEEVMARVTEPVAAKLEEMVADAVLELATDAFNPGSGDGGGHGGGGGKDTSAMNLNSANGPGGGSGPGGGGKMRVDHVEYEKAAGDLGRISETSLTRLNGSLDRADGARGRSKGRDALTQPIDGMVDGGVKGMQKAVRAIIRHNGELVPKNMRDTSENHKRNEKANEEALRKIMGDRDGKGGPNSPSSGPGGSGGKHGGGKPNKGERPADAELSQRARENSDKTKEGDPIDMATGEVLQTQTDLALPGVLPLVIERTHLSSYGDGRFFGPSWTSTLDERLERVPGTDELWWHGADGSSKRYSHAPDLIGEKVLPREGHRIPLTCVQGTSGWDLAVTDPRTGLTRRFLPTDGTTAERGDTTVWWLADIEDRNGNTISFHRDEDGAPSVITHSGGYHVVVDVSPAGADDPRRVTRIAVSDRAANGSSTTVMAYGYDPQRNLSELVNSSGLPMRFGYDAEHRMTSWTDRNDSTFTYLYDEQGRVICTVGPDGMLSCELAYDTEQRQTRYTDSTGAVTTYHLNHLGQTIAETNPLGHTTHTEWDRYDRVLARTDALGHTTRYGYDDSGNLVEAEHADGTRTTVTHNALNLPETTTLPDGGQIRQEYDTRGNLTRLTGPDGGTTSYTHDPSGAIATVTDALGHTATARNDDAGLPLAITDPLGATTTYTRDVFGRPISIVDPLGATTTVDWTVEGKPARRTSADGGTETWQWDGEGNCLVHTDAGGGRTRHTYTHFDQPVSRTTPDGATYTFVHDTELRLTGVTAPNGLAWSYRYDASGRLTAETDFDDRTVTYTYDAAGQLTSRATPLGETLAYELDPSGRITAKDAAGVVTRYTHDAVGRLETATSPTSTLSVRRDQAGRITSEIVDGHSLTYAYDALGRRTTRTTPAGVVTHYTYDAAGNRTQLALDGHTTAFQHDPLGRELERRFGNGLVLDTTWDSVGRPTAQTLTAPDVGGAAARTLRARTYAYRPDGHLTALIDQLTGNTQHFELDPIGRPLAVTAHDWQESYAYDLHGNQTRAQWPERAADPAACGERSYAGTRLLTAGRITYEYDAAGRTVTRRKTRLSRKPDVWQYTWDAEDRLTSCTNPDGSVWQYTYDPLGRRTGKHRLAADGTSVAESVQFTWDGTRLAEQATSTTGITLTWDHEGHRPLAQYERKPLTQDEVDTRFFAIVTDLVGTPTELVDETGRIAWHARTTTWGTTAWNADATAYTPLRYPGQYADPETGLHHNYFRHYDPETARYISADPLGLAPGPNPARYVDNPRRWSDPLGLAPYETFYRVMSQKEFDKLGPNGEISIKGTENFVTEQKEYVTGIAEQTTRKGGRNAEKYTHLVEYQMEPGTRDALIAAGRGSGDNINKVRDEMGIDLEEIGQSKDFVHVKYERVGLNFGLRPGSVDVFNSRIVGVSHQLLR